MSAWRCYRSYLCLVLSFPAWQRANPADVPSVWQAWDLGRHSCVMHRHRKIVIVTSGETLYRRKAWPRT